MDLPIDAGTCGRFVHAGYLRCIHCTRRRWRLHKHALNAAEVAVTAMLEEHAANGDALDGIPQPVPLLEDFADPCLVRGAEQTQDDSILIALVAPDLAEQSWAATCRKPSLTTSR